jgi:hypothetical protein
MVEAADVRKANSELIGDETPAKRPRQGILESASSATKGLSQEQIARIERHRALALERQSLGCDQAAKPTHDDEQVPRHTTHDALHHVTAAALTTEQLLQIERNRQAAQERRRLQGQEAPGSAAAALTDDQLLRIERNRLAALERQRLASQAVEADEAACKSEEAEEEEGEEEDEEDDDGELDELDSMDLEGFDFDALMRGILSDSESCASESESESESSRVSARDRDSSDGESDSSSSSGTTKAAVSQDPLPPAASVAPATSTALSKDLQERIERNRQAALEKRRLQMEASMAPKAPEPCAGASASSTSPNDGAITAGDLDMVQRIFGDSTPAKVPLPKSGKDRTPKQAVVARILCRWWYAMPPWPPEDFDFDAALRSAGFRKIPVEAFEFEPDYDKHGLKKVFALSGYVGLYRTEQGRLVDARPVEGKPSYDQLMVKSSPELHRMLLEALSNQLKDLESQPNSGRDFETHRQALLGEIKEARRATSFSQFFKVGGSKSAA